MADITRSGGKVTITSVPIRSLDFSINVAPWRSTRLLAIGKPSPAPCSADFIELLPWPNEASTTGISSSAMPVPLSFTLTYCPPRGCPAGLEPDVASRRRKLDGIAQKIEPDLAQRALIRPRPGHVGLEQLVDCKSAACCAHLQEVTALADHVYKRNRLLVELVAACLDARKVENLVDQAEKVHSRIVDVGSVIFVHRHRMRPENLALHYFGKPRIALSGVRSSWLICARKRDFATFAASARWRASSEIALDVSSSPIRASFSARASSVATVVK